MEKSEGVVDQSAQETPFAQPFVVYISEVDINSSFFIWKSRKSAFSVRSAIVQAHSHFPPVINRVFKR